MSKFRCRQLDATKPIPIYYQEDIYDSSEFNNVTNRSVPQLPTGMEKEEETEHHLQQAIFHHSLIPVPEVYESESHDDKVSYNELYPPNYKVVRQFIHIHPFSTEQDIPDYDMDSEDEEWLQEHARKGELLPLVPSQFEEMMDRLEKASGLKAVTLQEAKLLLKDDDDLITAVYDYWLNKRLILQHPLIHQVKTEKGLSSSTTDPYVAFRKRTEKMQTRKNRKNDETSYEKMLKLRRDLARAVSLLEMVKKREKTKRELLHHNIEVHEKRYELEDFSGAILNEITSQRSHLTHRSAFAPIMPNYQLSGELDHEGESDSLTNNIWMKVSPVQRSNKVSKRRDDGRRERRPYKKKKRNIVSISSAAAATSSNLPRSYTLPTDSYSFMYSQVGAPEDDVASTSHSEAEDDCSHDGYFAFKRKPLVSYLAPHDPFSINDESPSETFSLASVSSPHSQLIGLCRRRMGRGGRLLLDRVPLIDSEIKTEIRDTGPRNVDEENEFNKKWHHYHPSSISSCDSSSESDDMDVDVETVNENEKREATSSSSYVICAQVTDGGSNQGVITQLQVTLPPNHPSSSVASNSEKLDILPSNNNNPPSFLLEDDASNSPHLDELTPPSSGGGGLVNSSCNTNNSASKQSDALSSAISSNSVSNNNSTFNNDSPSCRESPILNNKKVNSNHSSVDFQTQPSSKFNESSSTSENSTKPPLENNSSSPYKLISKQTPSLSTSLNSLLCASQSIKNLSENTSAGQELNKKLMNLSSIYIRQPKDSSSQVASGFLLANNKRNILNNSNPKMNNTWTNNESNNDSVLTNGPSSKDNLKCTKVTSILFHET